MSFTLGSIQKFKREKLRHYCLTSALFINVLMASTLSAANTMFEMPDLARLIDIAIEHGQIEALVGQRHYCKEPVIDWDASHHQNSETPVFHAYGLGGGGLTLAPAVAKQVSQQVIAELKNRKDKSSREVLVFGAGYVGVFAARAIRQQLLQEGLGDVPVTVVAQTFTKGISSLRPDIPEPRLTDNFSSQIAGGWVMPVSVVPLTDSDLWCQMVNDAQVFWKKLADDPKFSTAVTMTQSLVFYEAGLKGKELREDKSGIRTVNKLCKPELYPEHEFHGKFYARSLENNHSTRLYFSSVSVFDNILEVDTNSILKFHTAELLNAGVKLVHVDGMLSDLSQLIDHSHYKKPIIVNASGHGAHNIFAGKQTWPIRGDLVFLRVPTSELTENLKTASKYTYWAGGTNYIFMRTSMDGRSMEIILGGTFVEYESDLTPNTRTIRDITEFWLSLIHLGSFDQTLAQQRVIQSYSDKVINKIF